MGLKFYQFASPPMDNYGVLIHAEETGETACVDAGDAAAVMAALDETGWKLSELWVTHHDFDHTDGIAEVKEKTGCHIIGPASQPTGKISGLDQKVSDGDEFSFAGRNVQVLHTPGHTLDLINYYLPDDNTLFASDTMFVMGCGRIKEGTPEQMWNSLQKLMSLPPETIIYCGHEYTQNNVEFALTVDPENEDLKNRSELISALRSQGESTVPTMLSIELATNPFLRVSDKSIRTNLNMENATDEQVFTEIRRRKDRF
ncbi:hydroxyacylglutathione hydrolase [Lentilitoribacter sp. EG35]|uniref:hydroxyacylglutathione hydrolase n=1 Tax=Lentilitoribacter sp. EG35 TaxID=3234192 RepID=UPI00345F92BE